MYVGAIDQGTSSSRFILFDSTGNKISSSQSLIQNHYVQAHPGWVEHDPMEILSSVQSCVADVMKLYKTCDVCAVGITNQRETTIVWDKHTGIPLHRAIVWLDTRTLPIVNRLINKYGSADYFRGRCGLPISTYFSAMKMMWLMENVPTVKEGCSNGSALFGTVDTWLIWNLTGGVKGGLHITDVSNASRTMLMNINTGQWDPTICKEYGIPLSVLPTIRSNSEVYGKVVVGALTSVPIAGCLGDQQAALVGQQCFEAGSAKNTYGTGCFMLLNTGSTAVPSTHGLLTTVGFQLGPQAKIQYALEGSIAVAGVGVKWLKDNMQLVTATNETNTLAESVMDNGGVYLVPAFSGLLSPYWRADARGVITGLTLTSTRAHLVRAMIEATAYQTRDVLEAMVKDAAASGTALRLAELRVDGGMTSSAFLMKFQANLLNTTVVRPEMMEATAAGAAFAAGLAVGYWKSLEDLKGKLAINKDAFTRFSPTTDKETHTKYSLFYSGWKRAITRTFDLAGDTPVITSAL